MRWIPLWQTSHPDFFSTFVSMKKLLLILLCSPLIVFGQTNTLGSDIINPNSKIKEVFSGGEGVLLEGPTMGTDGTLYFSDLIITKSKWNESWNNLELQSTNRRNKSFPLSKWYGKRACF